MGPSQQVRPRRLLGTCRGLCGLCGGFRRSSPFLCLCGYGCGVRNRPDFGAHDLRLGRPNSGVCDVAAVCAANSNYRTVCLTTSHQTPALRRARAEAGSGFGWAGGARRGMHLALWAAGQWDTVGVSGVGILGSVLAYSSTSIVG
jgi:hypothetical protein